MSEIAQAAERYARMGWKIFPLLPNAKQPYPGSEGYKDASTDWTAKTWPTGANIGFVPASADLVCIDLDPGHDEAFAMAHLPQTLEVETPHGYHCYYKAKTRFSNARLAAHIDVRSANGYTLLPPSVVDGAGYFWIPGGEFRIGNLIALPEHVNEKIHEAGVQRRIAATAGDDRPVNLNRARRTLQMVDPKTDGWVIACTLRRDLGLSEGAAIEIFDEWSQHQAWPWGYDKIEQLVINAGKYGHGAPEMTAPDSSKYPPLQETHSRWPARSTPQEDANQPRLTYWDKQKTMPKVPGGAILVVTGKQSHHKTGLVLKKCLDACDAGARILYVAAEGGYGIMTARLPAARQQRSMPWAALNERWWTLNASLNLGTDIREFIAHVADFRPNIVVFDTLTRTAGGFDLNTAQAVQMIYAELDQIMLEWGSLVVLIHHPKKAPDAMGASGSAQIEASAYATWHLKKADDLVLCWVDKMKDGRAEFEVSYRIDLTQGPPVIVDTQRTKNHSPSFVEVMAVLGSVSEVMSLTDIVDAIEPDPSRKENKRRTIEKQIRRAPAEFLPVMIGGADIPPKAWLFGGQKPK